MEFRFHLTSLVSVFFLSFPPEVLYVSWHLRGKDYMFGLSKSKPFFLITSQG
ncbi:hypothetical protein DESC_600092 [Desulfosarcina cetonica]|nr:hypothetical protein DESC_600092 [Desulfosarcina cetonica]